MTYKNDLKTSDHIQVQGGSRRKDAAYLGVCEYFEEAPNTAIGCYMRF
jgi:hypothetical protein